MNESMKGNLMKSRNTIFRNRSVVAQTTRGLITLLISVALLGINPAQRAVVARSATTANVVTPTTALPLTGIFQTINNLPGDQLDAHVDDDLASYFNNDLTQHSWTIRYFDFATNTDRAVPTNGRVFHSDVSGDRISFIEGDGTLSGPHIILFDSVLQTRTVVPGFGHLRPALGSNLVAFEQRTYEPPSNWFLTEAEIGVYDLSSGTVTSLSDDDQFDFYPAVSPTGNVVAWTKCQTNQSGCDIYTAVRTAPGVFNIQALTGTSGEEAFPRTNDQQVVYVAMRNGESDIDIYYQPVAGGAETRISIPGEQRSPNISGNLISFESETPDGFFDVFVYDINTAQLYQVTNTPGLPETLSDISVRDGIARVVYAAPVADYDLFAFTFAVPNSADDQINDLIELVESFDLPHGIEKSLITKLEDALAAVASGDTATACSSLTAFINESLAQSGKKLTADQATQLITAAQEIKSALGCQ
jgi:hypothetical protein